MLKSSHKSFTVVGALTWYIECVTTLVAGHTGLVGSAFFRLMETLGESTIGVNSKNLDLKDRKATFDFVLDHKPDIVVVAAAIVGGINSNNESPVNFLSENLQIQTNLVDASFQSGVERLVFLGSSCIYPRACKQPIREEYLLSGELETTNSAYAVAKIAGIELVKAYRRQYGKRWISLLPTNIYGPNDNFDLQTSHVLPALLKRFSEAKRKGDNQVILWGTGSPRREFLHSDDLAQAIRICIEKYDEDLHLNVGTGEDLSISELSRMIAEIVGFEGSIVWDSSKPDGTPRKVLDVSRIGSLGWKPSIDLKTGIKGTLDWYQANVQVNV